MREFRLEDGSVLVVGDEFEVTEVTTINDVKPRFMAKVKFEAIEAVALMFAQDAGFMRRSGSEGE